MDIKLIGLDLDGTLLHEDKQVSKSTIEYLEHLADKGIEIVPITGRPFSGIPKEVRSIKGVNFVITSNGSQIINNHTGKSLFEHPLSNKQTKDIICTLNAFDCLYEVFYDNFGNCDEKVFDHFKKVYTGTPLGDYIFSSRKVENNLLSVFENSQKCADEVFVICQDERQRKQIKAQTDKIPNIEYCLIADRFLEITNAGTHKGNALKELCDYLKIDLKNTIAFGDGENDIEFLAKAGISVAMGNAKDIVKQNADIITDTNDNDGVEKALKIYVYMQNN